MQILNNTFKTIQIGVFFTDVESDDTRVYRFLLPKLLSSHTDSLKNRKAFSEKCEHLYGAYIKTKTERVANLNIVSIILNIVDPMIVKDNKLFDEALFLLNEVIYHKQPMNENIFIEEKRMLIEQWDTYKDNKRLFASHRFNQIFFKHDPYGKPLSGSKLEIKKVTLKDIEDYYHQQFLNNARHIIVNGRLKTDQIEQIENMFNHEKRFDAPICLSFRKPNKLTIIEEKTQNLQQAIIKMGFICPIYRKDPLFDAAVILDTILGGYPESRLFKIIREEKHLCYDISSSYDHYKGVFLISSGVMIDRKDEAIHEIRQLIDQMIVDGISKLELETAKTYYIYQIKSSLDQQSYLTHRAYIRYLLNQNETIEERIESISKVTVDDVLSVLNQIKLDTIYVLKGDNHDQKI